MKTRSKCAFANLSLASVSITIQIFKLPCSCTNFTSSYISFSSCFIFHFQCFERDIFLLVSIYVRGPFVWLYFDRGREQCVLHVPTRTVSQHNKNTYTRLSFFPSCGRHSSQMKLNTNGIAAAAAPAHNTLCMIRELVAERTQRRRWRTANAEWRTAIVKRQTATVNRNNNSNDINCTQCTRYE